MVQELCFSQQYGHAGPKSTYYVRPHQSRNVASAAKDDDSKQKHGRNYFAWIGFWLRFALLPQGYPESVSGDYLQYQLWDTLQAFCSYLSGTLTTKAIMQGVGVGDAAATPLAATITWVIRDGSGMMGRILFASWKGPNLDANCKQWRLAADVLNDMAMALELCSPMLPEHLFPWALCLSTSMKSIVGVAGGATRAALTQHQARRGNMADVAAKDGSQETLVNLLASMTGVAILPLLTSDVYTWILFGLLTCLHLVANYEAVRCLDIPILNAQRFNLLLFSYSASNGNKIENSAVINARESVFLGTGMKDQQLCGFQINLGASINSLPGLSPHQLKLACQLGNEYIVLASIPHKTISVIFRHQKNIPALKAYFHAAFLGMKLRQLLRKDTNTSSTKDYGMLETEALIFASDFVAQDYINFCHIAELNGWLMDRHQLLVDEWHAEWSFEENYKFD